MRSLINELERSGQFDLVLFDTPPVLGLADAALVAEHCDGLMLLVGLEMVDRSLPKESLSRIRSSGVPLLGIITNALKREEQSSVYGYLGVWPLWQLRLRLPLMTPLLPTPTTPTTRTNPVQ